LKILRKITIFNDYNDNKFYPKCDTTILSPHNKFGTVSIREEYHVFKNKLGNHTDLLRQLYWRDFYYNQIFYEPNYFNMGIRDKSIKWNNNIVKFNKWKYGNTGIAIVDAGMKQLNKTGWIHNRIRLIVATMLTKILKIDWVYGARYFQKKLIDFDVTQNTMNWYWVSSETSFGNPYFKTLNPITQTLKYDSKNEYIDKWNSTFNKKKTTNA